MATATPVASTPYDASASVYDGAVHSAQAHTSEVVTVASHDASQGAQATVAAATGLLSVSCRLSVAADSVPDLNALAAEVREAGLHPAAVNQRPHNPRPCRGRAEVRSPIG